MAAEEQRHKRSGRARSRIPTFRTVEEEAAFWDSHSTTEFEAEFEEVTDVRFVRYQPKKAITVRLGRETLAALAEKAREMGIGPSTLVRMWITERLGQPEGQRPATEAP